MTNNVTDFSAHEELVQQHAAIRAEAGEGADIGKVHQVVIAMRTALYGIAGGKGNHVDAVSSSRTESAREDRFLR